MFKKIIISQIAKIKVMKSSVGRIDLKVSSLKLIPEEYREYQKFLFQAIEKLKGIDEVIVDIDKGSIILNYDINILNEKRVLNWVEKIKKIGIENFDLIEEYGATDLDYVVNIIEKQLDEAVKDI